MLYYANPAIFYKFSFNTKQFKSKYNLLQYNYLVHGELAYLHWNWNNLILARFTGNKQL